MAISCETPPYGFQMSSRDPEKGVPRSNVSSRDTALRYQAASAPVPWRVPIVSSVVQLASRGARRRSRSLAQR
eukprot:1530967-Lingulodinium_polyedra.AAC.1